MIINRDTLIQQSLSSPLKQIHEKLDVSNNLHIPNSEEGLMTETPSSVAVVLFLGSQSTFQ